MNSLVSVFRNLADVLGLDVISYALGFKKFTSTVPFQPSKFKEIEDKVHDLADKKLDDALAFSKEILDGENDRGDIIENKAHNLIGVTGISTAFVTGVTSLISDNVEPIFFWLIPVLYVFIVLSFTFTVLLASRVVIVGEYKYASPEISDVFNMRTQDLNEARKERLASYIYCYGKNFQVHNIKASYLIASQIWFRNAVILFLFLALTLVFSVSHKLDIITVTPTPLPSLSLTITPTGFTGTQLYTPTANVTETKTTPTTIPTLSPSETDIPVRPTKTLTPSNP